MDEGSDTGWEIAMFSFVLLQQGDGRHAVVQLLQARAQGDLAQLAPFVRDIAPRCSKSLTSTQSHPGHSPGCAGDDCSPVR